MWFNFPSDTEDDLDREDEEHGDEEFLNKKKVARVLGSQFATRFDNPHATPFMRIANFYVILSLSNGSSPLFRYILDLNLTSVPKHKRGNHHVEFDGEITTRMIVSAMSKLDSDPELIDQTMKFLWRSLAGELIFLGGMDDVTKKEILAAQNTGSRELLPFEVNVLYTNPKIDGLLKALCHASKTKSCELRSMFIRRFWDPRHSVPSGPGLRERLVRVFIPKNRKPRDELSLFLLELWKYPKQLSVQNMEFFTMKLLLNNRLPWVRQQLNDACASITMEMVDTLKEESRDFRKTVLNGFHGRIKDNPWSRVISASDLEVFNDSKAKVELIDKYLDERDEFLVRLQQRYPRYIHDSAALSNRLKAQIATFSKGLVEVADSMQDADDNDDDESAASIQSQFIKFKRDAEEHVSSTYNK